MNNFNFAWILIGIISLTAASLQGENQKSTISEQWMDIIRTQPKQLTDDGQQQMEAAVKFLSMLSRHPRFAGISKMFLEDNSEVRDNTLQSIQYVLMKTGMASGFNKFVEKKIQPAFNEWETQVNALKEILKYKDGKHRINRLAEYLAGPYLEHKYKAQQEAMNQVAGLKEMMDKFKTLREYLAENNLK